MPGPDTPLGFGDGSTPGADGAKRSPTTAVRFTRVTDELTASTWLKVHNEIIPTDPVTVIVRILPAFRRQGFGSALLVHAMTHAREWDAVDIQTIVLESNADGLEFAVRRGFAETDRYTLDGDAVAYVHLATSPAGAILGDSTAD